MEALEKPPPRLLDGLVAVQSAREELLDLGLVRGRRGDAGEAREIVAGVRRHHRPGGRERPHRREERRRDRSVAVVREHDGVGAGRPGAEAIQELGLRRRRQGARRLPVHAHDLLALRYHARLGRGGPVGDDAEVAVGEARLHQLRLERVAAAIVADDGDQPAIRADRRDVGGDVRGAAQGVAPRVDRHHGHRRFGRDAVGVAREVDVEHRVADHDDAALGHLLEQGG